MPMSGGGSSPADMLVLAGRMTAAETAQAAFDTAMAGALSAITALQSAQAFVDQTPMTVANLLANYPAGPTYLGKYAKVTDLWGSVYGVMRCSKNSSGRHWWATTDQEEFAVRNSGSPSGTTTMQPLAIPQIMLWNGSGPGTLITGNVTVGLTGAYPGLVKQFENGFGAFLGALNILGTGLGSGLASLLGSTTKIVCIDTGAALEWRKIG